MSVADAHHDATKRTNNKTEIPFDKAVASTYIQSIVAPAPDTTKVGGTEFTHLYMSGAHATCKMIDVHTIEMFIRPREQLRYSNPWLGQTVVMRRSATHMPINHFHPFVQMLNSISWTDDNSSLTHRLSRDATLPRSRL